jgi:hypothetical protein
VTVKDAAPVVEIGGASSVVEQQTYTLLLSANDPGGQSIVRWEIDWGDGSPLEVLEGNPEIAEHVFLGPGPATRLVTATAFDEGGSSATDTWTVNVTPDYLNVVSIEVQASGYHVQFDQRFDPARFTLYGQKATGNGVGDARLVSSTGTEVRGTAIVDADGKGFTFVRTGGLLAQGTYTLTLSGQSIGFVDLQGRGLDGNQSAGNGDDFVTTVNVGAETGPVVTIGEFARGPGQPVNLPATGTGIPINLINGADLSEVEFEVAYDVSKLVISNVVAAAPNATVTFQNSGGVLHVLVRGLNVGAGSTRIASIIADVPAAAASQYTSKQVLDVGSVVGRAAGGEIVRPGVGDDGVHVVGYFGETSGNGRLSIADVSLLQRVVTGLDTGFAAYQLADPTLVADISGNGVISVADQSLLQREVQSLGNPALDVPQIPTIPPLVDRATGGPDPLVDLPDALSVQAGNVVTVPVNLDTAAGLHSAELRLSYDADLLEFVDVRRGALTQDFGWLVKRSEPGLLVIEVAAVIPLSAGSGSLVEVDLRAKSGSGGQTLLDLEWASLNDGGLTLNPAPQAGADSTDSMLSIAAAPLVAPTVISASMADLSVGTRKASGSAYAPILAAQALAPNARPATLSQGPAPVIDWGAKAKLDSAPRPADAAGMGAGKSDWAKAFVNDLGKDASDPNKKLRISKVVAHTASKLASMLKGGR